METKPLVTIFVYYNASIIVFGSLTCKFRELNSLKTVKLEFFMISISQIRNVNAKRLKPNSKAFQC